MIRKLLLKAFCLGLLFGCEKEMKTTPPEVPQDLRLLAPRVSFNADPHKMEDAYSMLVALQVYRGLFRYRPDGEVVQDLVESYSASPDHLIYRFKLKAGLKFSDGTQISAENVRHSIARIFHLNAAMGADINYIQGVSEFQKTKDVRKLGLEVLSPSEIEFRLSQPSALLIKHLAVVDCAILPIKTFDVSDSIDGRTASGPYKVTELSSDKVVIERWRPDSLDSINPPKRVSLMFSNDDPLPLANKEQIDALDDQTLEQVKLSSLLNAGWKQVVTELSQERFVIMNPKSVPLQVREYLFRKTKPEEIVRLLGNPSFVPAYGLIPSVLAGSLGPQDNGRPADIEDTNKNPKGTFELVYSINHFESEKIAKYLQALWQTQGLHIILKPKQTKDYLDQMFAGKGQLIMGAKKLDYPDGFSVLGYFRSGISANYFHTNSIAIDTGLNSSLKVFDSAERSKLYKEIQMAILRERTVIPLFFGTAAAGLWSSRVTHVPPHPMGFHTIPFEMISMQIKK